MTVHLDGPTTVPGQMAEREEGGSENWAAEAISVLDPGAADPTRTEPGAGPLRAPVQEEPRPESIQQRSALLQSEAGRFCLFTVLSSKAPTRPLPPPSVTTEQPDRGSQYIHVGVGAAGRPGFKGALARHQRRPVGVGVVLATCLADGDGGGGNICWGNPQGARLFPSVSASL